MIKNFDYYPEDRKIYEEEIRNFIPERIFDFHIHLWKKEQLKDPLNYHRKELDPFLDFDAIDNFDISYCLEIACILFPDKKFEGLYFGDPFPEIDLAASNKMIKDEVNERGFYGLYIVTPDEDSDLLKKTLLKGGFRGLKPYPELCQSKEYRLDQDNISIFNYLTHDHLKIANELGMIVILHIPKTKRLNDQENLENISEISASYPRIKLVLAHAGRSFCEEDIADSIKGIVPLKNVFVDISMINNWEVLKILIENLGNERVLYGSDFPIAALRGKNISINGKHYFVTDIPFGWSISAANLDSRNITFFIYEEIRELKKAILFLDNKNSKYIAENIFYNNAVNLIKG